jgi:DNA-binding transcriptional regulator YiaG
MACKKSPKRTVASPRRGGLSRLVDPHVARLKAPHADWEQDLNEVDREVLGALADFRDTLQDRTPLEQKYTVRRFAVVTPPPQLAPDDVRKTREALGVSQPIFAGLLGTSVSTVRSWEQGQKIPSPMARRFLAVIASDLRYWKEKFISLIET